MRRLVKLDFVRFCLVGAGGFIINFAVLSLLYKVMDVPLLIAQAIAAEIALAHNFAWHHHWTYKHHRVRKSIGSLIVQFHATSWVAIVGSAFLMTGLVEVAKMEYFTSLVITAATAMLWNFAWSKFAIWRHEEDTEGAERPATK